MLFLSGIIMAVAAGTLHVMGLKLENTVEMIYLFEPIGGKVAALILIVGITGAGLSTIFPIVLIAPWLVSDYMGKPRDIQSPMFRWLMFGGLIFAFGSFSRIDSRRASIKAVLAGLIQIHMTTRPKIHDSYTISAANSNSVPRQSKRHGRGHLRFIRSLLP